MAPTTNGVRRPAHMDRDAADAIPATDNFLTMLGMRGVG